MRQNTRPQLVEMTGAVATKFKEGDLLKIKKEFEDAASKITEFTAKKGDAYIYKVTVGYVEAKVTQK